MAVGSVSVARRRRAPIKTRLLSRPRGFPPAVSCVAIGRFTVISSRIANNAGISNSPAPQGADPSIEKVIDGACNLEFLVKELSWKLQQVHAATGLASGSGRDNSACYDYILVVTKWPAGFRYRPMS